MFLFLVLSQNPPTASELVSLLVCAATLTFSPSIVSHLKYVLPMARVPQQNKITFPDYVEHHRATFETVYFALAIPSHCGLPGSNVVTPCLVLNWR